MPCRFSANLHCKEIQISDEEYNMYIPYNFKVLKNKFNSFSNAFKEKTLSSTRFISDLLSEYTKIYKKYAGKR